MNQFLQRIEKLSPKRLALLACELQAKIENLERAASEPIAIVGTGCRMPGGAHNPDAFWELLRSGRDTVGEVPPDRWDIQAYYHPDPDAPGRMSTRCGSFLDGIGDFDAPFFGISRREAVRMDPQQRLLMEVSWEALEDAAQSPRELSGSRTGVFFGLSTGDYHSLLLEHGASVLDAYLATGTAHSIAAGRVAYTLGLQGPNFAIDTACSSSLVAVHLACQSLRAGECSLALAGGVNAILLPDLSIALSKSHMMAPDGRCKAFDARADGFVRGEGCGIIVLKRLSDAIARRDRILAVIRGSAVSQDGRSSGITAPNGAAQEAVIRQALENARVEPHEISYIETHGTGTSLGDPIEAHALANVFRTGRTAEHPLLLGSAKTNIGHLEAAAGIAGLIKVVLALRHGYLPPHLHFKQWNPHIHWNGMPIEIPVDGRPWTAAAGRRLAGVSSFGFSGTNVHIVVEEAPAPPPRAGGMDRPQHLVALSARSADALVELREDFGRSLVGCTEPLGDVCFTANAGRSHFEHRAVFLASSTEDLRARMDTPLAGGCSDRSPEVVFLFSGQGAQYPGMGRELFDTQPVFRAGLEECDRLLRRWLDPPLLEVLYGAAHERLNETAFTQPALFALEYSLAQLWQSWGIQPAAVLGHSVGEYAAACVAGACSLAGGLELIAERGRRMQALGGRGGMTAVMAPEAMVREALRGLEPWVSIAAVNAPESVVISGWQEQLQLAEERLRQQDVRVQPLTVSHAFHSAQMDPMVDEFAARAAAIGFQTPRVALISSVTGEPVTAAELSTPDYWRRQVRNGVQFRAAMETLERQGRQVYLEIGPGTTLLGLGGQCLGDEGRAWLASLRRGQPEWRQMLESLGQLYVRGAEVDWAGFDAPYDRRRVSLPTYPFQRQRYWIEAAPRPAAVHRAGDLRHPILEARLPAAIPVYEGWLSTSTSPFFADHRVGGTAILPASGYLELAMAAADLEGGTVRRLEIREPLRLHEAPCRVQVVLHPSGAGESHVQIFAREEDQQDWTLHASCAIEQGSPETVPSRSRLGNSNRINSNSHQIDSNSPQIDGNSRRIDGCSRQIDGGSSRIDNIPDRAATVRERSSPPDRKIPNPEDHCTREVLPAVFYETMRQHGTDLGPSCRSIRALRCGPREAIAEVEIEASLSAASSAFRTHPGLLDACFQALGAALLFGDTDPVPHVLAGIASFRLAARPHGRVRVHAVLLPGGPGEPVFGQLSVFDAAGRTIAEAAGIQLKPVAPERPAGAPDWFYTLSWERSTNPNSDVGGVPPIPRNLIRELEQQAGTLSLNQGYDRYGLLRPRLDALAGAYMADALAELGAAPEHLADSDLAARCGVVDRHRTLFANILHTVTADRGGKGINAPEALWEALRQEFPEFAVELDLTRRCGRELVHVLRGVTDPLHLLFPNGSFAELEKLYTESPGSRVFNELLRQTVSTIVGVLSPGRAWRVLEIGAGTGASTSSLVRALPADRTEYVYTDVSPVFLARAREKFAKYPFFRYEVLDIEQDPALQGFAGSQFDLVVAANVLHATADLRRTLAHVAQLLAPNGLMIAVEGTRPERWIDLTFGMTEGWWKFHDTDLRPDYPLLSKSRWLELLASAGFHEPAAVQPRDSQQVMLLGLAAGRKSAPAGRWLIVQDDQDVAASIRQIITARGGSVDLVVGGWSERPLAPYDQVLHLGSLDAPSSDLLDGTALAATAGRLYPEVVQLAQSLARCPGRSPKLWLATRGALGPDIPGCPVEAAQAPVWGLGRTLALEHPEFWGGLVDLDPRASAAVNAASIVDSILHPDDEDQMAFRSGMRYVPRLVHRTPPAAEPVSFSPEAVYLITGGLGSLGLTVARWMVGNGARRLVLLGRNGLPERSGWDALPPGTRACSQARAVREIERLGATVRIAALDIADPGMPHALAAIVEPGELRGIVHAAAAFDFSTVREMSPAALASVLHPKVAGAWALHEWSKSLSLDFFVTFSSTTSLLGGRRLAHYAAANQFLDALAHYRRAANLPALVVNWGTWDEMGDTPEESRRDYLRTGLNPMNSAIALDALGRVLGAGDPQAIVASIDWGVLRSVYEARRRRPFLERLSTAAPVTAASADVEAKPDFVAELGTAPASERQGMILTLVRTQAAAVLGLQPAEVEFQAGLFELGMDSLMSVELKGRLEKRVGLALPSTLTFNYPTVRALSAYLSDLLQARLPAQEHSEDELAQLLAAALKTL